MGSIRPRSPSREAGLTRKRPTCSRGRLVIQWMDMLSTARRARSRWRGAVPRSAAVRRGVWRVWTRSAAPAIPMAIAASLGKRGVPVQFRVNRRTSTRRPLGSRGSHWGRSCHTTPWRGPTEAHQVTQNCKRAPSRGPKTAQLRSPSQYPLDRGNQAPIYPHHRAGHIGRRAAGQESDSGGKLARFPVSLQRYPRRARPPDIINRAGFTLRARFV